MSLSRWLLLGSILIDVGCASCPPCEVRAATCTDAAPAASGPALAPRAAPDASAPPSAASAAPSAPATAPPPAVEPPPGVEPTSPSPPPPPNAKSLPEVKVETVGLHIGGGPNDDATKKPFLTAIEQRFDLFRACYAKVEDPKKGGTFGVDLHIGKNGGKPEVKQPRTGMKGDAFRRCVANVFENVEFDKPKKGPTVVSYSIRFSLVE
jgi:hypothetical protein